VIPRLVFALGISALLAACGIIRGLEPLEPAPWVQDGGPRPASDGDSLILYYSHLRKLSGPELGREHDVARLAHNRVRSEFNRIRLAMVLSLPNTAFHDEARSLELLEPVAKNPGGRLQGLALLLSSHLQEQRRLSANAQGLQQKLDALKSLERSLIERDAGGAARKR
jgi:hypothetical protein